jgi:outer membrane protein insertion porin family
MYYQNYSISFFDPWLGGKRPNSFSVSFFYSVQTGLSNRYYENYSYMYNYYNNYYNNYYGNDYYYGTNNYGTEYDKNVFMRTIGASVGYGTRLKWPDDYFTFYGNISYQRYNLKNWFKSYYGFETGVTNDLSLGLNISRNSIDNPIYTRRGSSLSLSVAATFPYSLLTKDVDYASMDLATRSKWIEYHKWKFNAKFFVPLTYDNKLVLMARADYGFLGYYNKDKRSPFGKFYVGGDGMSGYTTAGTETVGLRGYEAGSLTPYSGEGYYGYNGNLYTKLTVELRYPLLLNQSTNIWALAFVEAGNAWAEFKDFNPFDLKRSAGAGVRVYLPMFGLLGIDWAYGFDHDQTGRRGGSQFHFILGQEF